MSFSKTEWVLGKVLENHAKKNADKPFIQFEDGPIHTYSQAHALSNRVGNAYAAQGVLFGDNIALMLNNCLEYLWCWIGLSRIGAVPVAINTALKGSFLTHVLTNTGSRVGIFDEMYLELLEDIEDTIPELAIVYVLGDIKKAKLKRIEVRSFEDIMDHRPDDIHVDVTYHDTAAIMFTSGTTGPSKGVVMPHAHLYLFGECLRSHMQITSKDKYYITLPLFHAQGLAMMTYGTMIAGASAVLTRGFSASTWISDIKKYGVTLTNLLGAMNDFVLAQPKSSKDKDNQLRMICALPVSNQTLEQLKERFNIPKFFEAYGMTECNIPIARPFEAPDKAGCSGKIWADYFEVIIADPDTDEQLPLGQVGEILVRPREAFGFMQHYNGMPEKTVETWRNMWFHTGDAGRLDEDGYIWYIDRINDTIRRRGENISSYEVETVLLEHPLIIEAAAVAVKADVGGEDEVLACLVLDPKERKINPTDILDFCLSRMPYFSVPRYIEFFDELPKTPNLKIKKNELRDRGLTASTWDREKAGYKVTRN